jgi:hypothetical protein
MEDRACIGTDTATRTKETDQRMLFALARKEDLELESLSYR